MKIMPQLLHYERTALEPYLSGKLMQYHYDTVYCKIIGDLNTLTENTIYKNTDETTLIKISKGQVFMQALQAWNHAFYFSSLKPGFNKIRQGSLKDAILGYFGSEKFFRDSFINYALTLKDEGWVWLILNQEGCMELIRDHNTSHPIKKGLIPLLNCDLWNHAYFEDYQDNRLRYLESFLKLINWDLVEKRFYNGLRHLAPQIYAVQHF